MIKITKEVLEAANNNYVSLDELVYLYTILFGLGDWPVNIAPVSLNKLQRLNLIADNVLTPGGEALVIECFGESSEEEKPKPSSDFDEIWLMFPRYAKFRHWDDNRPIRYNKELTRKKYEEALLDLPHETLVSCLQKELRYRSTFSTKENLFKYMKISYNWFGQQAYREFIDDEEIIEKDDFGKEIKWNTAN